ncbi:MAG: polysaccharide deacetylase family protein [Bacteroidetes bacterium]|nr:polysaccharide deacetylase family protein [Bacteroidota bacterium]
MPSSSVGPELLFTVDYLLGHRLGMAYTIIETAGPGQLVELWVGSQVISIPHSGFFGQLEQGISAIATPEVTGHDADCVLFPMALPQSPLWEFDLLAAVYYLLARLEELAPAWPRDPHGRVLARACATHAHGGHRYPLIDIWVARLRHQLHNLEVRGLAQESFAWWNTIDIDQVYASKGKPLWIRLSGIARALLYAHLTSAQKLAQALVGGPDPFEVLDQMKMPAQRNLLFLLCGGTTRYDLTKSRHPSILGQFVQAHLHDFEWGIHPSYASSQHTEIIALEKHTLETLTNRPVHYSRQHFLRFTWPHTQQSLLGSGITHDFSMGFADEVGFRAGTSRPYPFFNPLSRQPTALTIVPFSTMDVTLRRYMGHTPKQAGELILHIIQTLKECHGLYVSLWHHEALAEMEGWKGWKKLYLDIAKTLID